MKKRKVQWTTSNTLLEYVDEYVKICKDEEYHISRSDLISLLVICGLNQLNHYSDEAGSFYTVVQTLKTDLDEYYTNYD